MEALTITEFIHARLNDKERLARAAIERTGSGNWKMRDHESDNWMVTDSTGEVVVYDEGDPSEFQAAHIAANDPEQALREVAAHRTILDAHPLVDGECGTCKVERERWMIDPYASEEYVEHWWDAIDYPCPTVRALAGIWSRHPQYNPEWRPL